MPRHDRQTRSLSGPSTCCLPRHTHVPDGFSARSHAEENIPWLFCLVLIFVHSKLTFYLFYFTNQTPPRLSQVTDCGASSLCGFCFVWAETVRALIWGPRLSQHTSWDPSHSPTPSRNTCTFPQAGKTRKAGTCRLLLLLSWHIMCFMMYWVLSCHNVAHFCKLRTC